MNSSERVRGIRLSFRVPKGVRNITQIKTHIAKALRELGFPIAKLQDKAYKDKRAKFILAHIENILNEEDLPEKFLGAGRFDERVVEYALLAWFLRSQAPVSRMMDLGMSVNNDSVKAAVEKNVEKLRFVNPAPDEKLVSFTPAEVFSAGIKDFNSLPSDNTLLTSISTVEHVGYDNSQYGLRGATQYFFPSQKLLRLLALFADSVTVNSGASVFVSFPIWRKQLNLHPVTLRFASQTFGRSDVDFFIAELSKQGFYVRFDSYSIVGEDFVRNDPEVWKKRYGQGVVAATGVAIVRASR